MTAEDTQLNGTGEPLPSINHDANYEFVKHWLRRGEVHTLATRHKISRSTAYKILRGHSKNYDFLKACYEMALERAQTFQKIDQKIHSL